MMLVIMAGLPGTGKTTLARELAVRIQGRVLSKDEIRHSLFAEKDIEYSARQDDFCAQIMLEAAGYLLRRDPKRIIFLDGRPFSRRYQIENALNAAAALHQNWRIIECVCADEIVRCRLQEQASQWTHPAGNRDFELYLKVKARFEAITFAKTVSDTERPLDICVEEAIAALG
jgi:predicted kinase